MRLNEHFKESLNIGSIGERVAWDLLVNSSKTKQVVDVRRDNRHFRNIDVDFLWETINNNIYFIEVKTDSQAHETGNIVYEITTSGNIGCFEKTQADAIMYYILETKEMYWISTFSLKAYIEKNKDSLRIVNMGDNATGYLLRIDDLVQLNVMKAWRNE